LKKGKQVEVKEGMEESCQSK